VNATLAAESESAWRGPGSASSSLAPIAYHEAGHVVVGHLLGLQLLGTDILPDDEGGRGHTHFAPPGSWFQPEGGRLSARERDLIERVLTTFMAGFAAESRHGEADVEGSGYDLDQSLREWVSYVADTTQGREVALRGFLERATSIVEGSQAWAAIEAVAAALLAEGQLSGSAAAQIARIDHRVDSLPAKRPLPGA